MRFFLWPRRRQEDLDDEIQGHLQMAVRDRVERGESTERARDAARRELGNVGLIKDATREMWGWTSLERFIQDLRYGLRMLARAPGFAAVAILTLALGIGANTALFSVVNGVLLNPLPFPQPDRLVILFESKVHFEEGSISYQNFLDWQRDNRSFSSMVAYRGDGFNLTGAGEAERVHAEMISAGFFPTLGVKPSLGRVFNPEEDRLGGAPVALISAGFWKRKFGSAPDILGKNLTLNGTAYTIIGVIPASFRLQTFNFRESDVYVPIGQWNEALFRDRKTVFGMDAIGRLRPGITLAQAKADMDEVTRNLAAAYPEANKGIGATLVPLKEHVVGEIQPFLLVLLGAVGFVLLIACVNVANLLLARSTGRAREFAIRAALGASQGRVVRQLLTESILLAIAGGGLGLLLAAWGTQAAVSLVPGTLPRAEEVRLDAHVLIFTIAVSVLSGVLFGLAPALKTSQPNLQEALKEGGRGAGGARHRTHGVFVVVEMAMALILLIGAGLMIRSLARLWSVNPGFNPHNVLTFGVSLPSSMKTASPDAIRASLRQLHDKLEAIPGGRAASLIAGSLPMYGDSEDPFWIEGRAKPLSDNDKPWALWYEVEPDYLKVMAIPLERGRFFTPADDEHAPLVAVIDDSFAAKYFPDEDPTGKRVVDDYWGPAEIVGVVGHVNHWGLDDSNSLHAQLYFPFRQIPDKYIRRRVDGGLAVVRSTGAPLALEPTIRRAIEEMNSEQVMYTVRTMDEIISNSVATRRFSMILLGVFAGLALMLSSVGIYGVVSYLVGQRTHEIGIRMALGAQQGDVLRLVIGEGVKMAILGVAIGLAAALALTRLLADLLYGVSATDPLTFAGVAALLLVVALAACYIPARRAMRVDPMVALRYE